VKRKDPCQLEMIALQTTANSTMFELKLPVSKEPVEVTLSLHTVAELQRTRVFEVAVGGVCVVQELHGLDAGTSYIVRVAVASVATKKLLASGALEIQTELDHTYVSLEIAKSPKRSTVDVSTTSGYGTRDDLASNSAGRAPSAPSVSSGYSSSGFGEDDSGCRAHMTLERRKIQDLAKRLYKTPPNQAILDCVADDEKRALFEASCVRTIMDNVTQRHQRAGSTVSEAELCRIRTVVQEEVTVLVGSWKLDLSV
jgi:hypothetical protein